MTELSRSRLAFGGGFGTKEPNIGLAPPSSEVARSLHEVDGLWQVRPAVRVG